MKRTKLFLAVCAVLLSGFSASRAQSIAGGYHHSLFVCSDSTARACGNNQWGQLGDGTNVNKLTPVQVPYLTGITAVAAGSFHSLFLKNDSTVWACGYNGNGELGNGTTADTSFPVQVPSLTGITAVASGDNHSLFLKNDGTAWVCGDNQYGQLGDGTTTDKLTPVQGSGLCSVLPPIAVEFLYSGSNWKFKVFPNPARAEINIELAEGSKQLANEKYVVRIKNSIGQQITQRVLPGPANGGINSARNLIIDTSQFPKGLCLVEVCTVPSPKFSTKDEAEGKVCHTERMVIE